MIGAWLSHVKLWKYALHNNFFNKMPGPNGVEYVLIFEDDADIADSLKDSKSKPRFLD
jgi:GR25 family glycosyltransferase involved in LPS biosynthesis